MADLDHLHPTFRARVLATGVAVASGARSHKRQGELYQDYIDGVGNPANPPGSSWHEYDEGAAFPNPDSAGSSLVGGVWALAVDFAEPYPRGAPGLCFPIRGEPWHAQPVEITETARVPGAWQRLPGAVVPPAPAEDLVAAFTYSMGPNVWASDGLHTRHVPHPAVLDAYRAAGVPHVQGNARLHDFLRPLDADMAWLGGAAELVRQRAG